MSILITCPSCQSELRFPEAIPVGRSIGCPNCGYRLSATSSGTTSSSIELDSRHASPAGKRGRSSLLIALACVVALLGGAALWYFNDALGIVPDLSGDLESFLPEGTRALLKIDAKPWLADQKLREAITLSMVPADGVPALTRLASWGIPPESIKTVLIALIREPEMDRLSQQSLILMSWDGNAVNVRNIPELSEEGVGQRWGASKIYQIQGTHVAFLPGNRLLASTNLRMVREALQRPKGFPEMWKESGWNTINSSLRLIGDGKYLQERASDPVFAGPMLAIAPFLDGVTELQLTAEKVETAIDFTLTCSMQSSEEIERRGTMLRGLQKRIAANPQVMKLSLIWLGQGISNLVIESFPKMQVETGSGVLELKGQIFSDALIQLLPMLTGRSIMPFPSLPAGGIPIPQPAPKRQPPPPSPL
jgi:hypothetical protein